MGSHDHNINIDITHVRPSGPPSPAVSDDDELQEDGVHVSPHGVSPHYAVAQAPSQSGSSSHPGDFVPLQYPGELTDSETGHDLHPSHSASRLVNRDRHLGHTSRSHSARREAVPRRVFVSQGPPRSRPRPPPPEESPTESGDSTEDFLREPDYDPRMPRPQSYYGQNGYTHSSSSGSFGYPQVPPHSSQMIHYAPPQPHQPPPPAPYQYPSPQGYPSAQPNYHNHAINHQPASQVVSPYGPSPYGTPAVAQYGAPQGYFNPQFGPGQQYPPQYPPPYIPQYPNIPPMMPAHMYYTRTDTPHRQPASPPPTSAPEPPKVDEEAITKKIELLLLAQNEAREAREKDREKQIQSAEDKVAAMAVAEAERRRDEQRIREEAIRAAEEEQAKFRRMQAERMAEEKRIREEARLEALEAEKARIAAEAERAAYEARIRREAAEAALAAAAAESKAKADQAAKEAKIAADAAEAATTAAKKSAADEAAAAEAKAKADNEEAAKKLKEAEDAMTKAKKEAEDAQAVVKANTAPEKQAPIRFKDALGRNYNFPWERCCKWRDMEGLIVQAFAHIENLGPHVMDGHYDLIGPDKEIIMPEYWEDSIAPNMHITMMLWPLPEPKLEPEPIPPPPGEAIDIEALLNGGKKPKKDAKKRPRPGTFSSWMLGGVPTKSKPVLKDDKKPEVAAGIQHGAAESGACIVM